ncbi:toxin-antitoxin system YwqK family antitoxin [Bacteroides uniformis]|jgi:hypothetical protein|uniref:toxin-antitoxin system YwqK family antitoxin n=1 Tax=Bacteroides uniformis TaxID=820 RepID=UPI001107313E|nr:hypothetical protein [Bacteroides uniformis]MDC1839307.1 hypothetical protein [Bacteroides uniformis]MDC1865645.1 hypothetical protein [Bacteroides uniformis]MDC1869980.1 hypothetical protein [Bacteroides uniformis]
MRRIPSFAIATCFSLLTWAQQDTVFLNAQKVFVKKKAKAKECVLMRKAEDGSKWVDFYTLDGKQTASSQYKKFGKTPDSQILHGITRYRFHDSEQDSLQLFYRNNCRNGGATFYYPNGKILAKGQYKDGKLDGLLHQFYEDGKLKRMEVYKDDCCIRGKYLTPDSTEIEFSPFYQPAQFETGEFALGKIMSEFFRLPTDLLKEMADKNRLSLKAHVGIVVNADGKAVDVIILSTEHPKLNASCFEGLLEMLSQYVFIPGEIDNQKCTTIASMKSPFLVRISPHSINQGTTVVPGNTHSRTIK